MAAAIVILLFFGLGVLAGWLWGSSPEITVQSPPTIIMGKTPEPEIIYGDVEEVTVYLAKDKARVQWDSFPSSVKVFSHGPDTPSWHGKHFLSCEQAFAECGDCLLESVVASRIAGKYFQHFKLTPLKLAKPKVAKGRGK